MATRRRPYKAQKYNYTPLFEAVAFAYLENLAFLSFATIQTTNIDETIKKRSPFWSAEYIADVETTTRAALGGQTHLEDALDQMLAELNGCALDASLSLGLRSAVIEKCGKAYRRNGLDPGRYFIRVRK
jgi:hypothetical protein